MNLFIHPLQRALGALVAILVAFGSVQADSSKPEQRRFAQNAATAPGQTLYLEAHHAEIVVSGSDENKIALEATVELSSDNAEARDAFFAETQLLLEPHGQDFRAVLKLPEWGERVGGQKRIFRLSASAVPARGTPRASPRRPARRGALALWTRHRE